MIQFQRDGLTVFQSALYQTTCTVVEADEFVLIADPNWLPHEIQEIQQHVAQIRNGRELYVLFTHGDFDHIIGYHAFPGAKIIASKGLQEHPHKEQKLNLIQQFDHDYYIVRPYPTEFPKVDIVLEEDGQRLVLGNTTITFYLSPGHTQDGIFTVIEPLGLWIAGDYLSDFELPFIYHSAIAYGETLEKAERILHTHEVKVLVPGHGQCTEKVEEMRMRIQRSQMYLSKLIDAVINEDDDAVQALGSEHPFPSSFTKESHEKNVDIIQQEYKNRK